MQGRQQKGTGHATAHQAQPAVSCSVVLSVVCAGVWCGSVVAVKVIQVKQPSALTFPYHRAAHSTAHHADDMHEQHHQQQDALSQQHVLVGGGDTTAMATAAAGGTSTSSTDHIDSQAAQVALELAQHEYESWLNANLRHPNIVQLFTSFTIGLEEPRGPLVAPPPHHPLLAGGAGGCGGGSGGDMMAAVGGGAGVGMTMSVGGGLSWRTHLVMEYCELGTMQVGQVALNEAVLVLFMFLRPAF